MSRRRASTRPNKTNNDDGFGRSRTEVLEGDITWNEPEISEKTNSSKLLGKIIDKKKKDRKHDYVDKSKERTIISNHKTVISTLSSIWTLMPKEGPFINYNIYEWFSRKLYYDLAPSSEEDPKQVILEDWNRDSHGKGYIDRKDFTDKLFHLADTWCETTEVLEYVAFLERCKEALFLRGNPYVKYKTANNALPLLDVNTLGLMDPGFRSPAARTAQVVKVLKIPVSQNGGSVKNESFNEGPKVYYIRPVRFIVTVVEGNELPTHHPVIRLKMNGESYTTTAKRQQIPTLQVWNEDFEFDGMVGHKQPSSILRVELVDGQSNLCSRGFDVDLKEVIDMDGEGSWEHESTLKDATGKSRGLVKISVRMEYNGNATEVYEDEPETTKPKENEIVKEPSETSSFSDGRKDSELLVENASDPDSSEEFSVYSTPKEFPSSSSHTNFDTHRNTNDIVHENVGQNDTVHVFSSHINHVTHSHPLTEQDNKNSNQHAPSLLEVLLGSETTNKPYNENIEQFKDSKKSNNITTSRSTRQSYHEKEPITHSQSLTTLNETINSPPVSNSHQSSVVASNTSGDKQVAKPAVYQTIAPSKGTNLTTNQLTSNNINTSSSPAPSAPSSRSASPIDSEDIFSEDTSNIHDPHSKVKKHYTHKKEHNQDTQLLSPQSRKTSTDKTKDSDTDGEGALGKPSTRIKRKTGSEYKSRKNDATPKPKSSENPSSTVQVGRMNRPSLRSASPIDMDAVQQAGFNSRAPVIGMASPSAMSPITPPPTHPHSINSVSQSQRVSDDTLERVLSGDLSPSRKKLAHLPGKPRSPAPVSPNKDQHKDQTPVLNIISNSPNTNTNHVVGSKPWEEDDIKAAQKEMEVGSMMDINRFVSLQHIQSEISYTNENSKVNFVGANDKSADRPWLSTHHRDHALIYSNSMPNTGNQPWLNIDPSLDRAFSAKVVSDNPISSVLNSSVQSKTETTESSPLSPTKASWLTENLNNSLVSGTHSQDYSTSSSTGYTNSNRNNSPTLETTSSSPQSGKKTSQHSIPMNSTGNRQVPTRGEGREEVPVGGSPPCRRTSNHSNHFGTSSSRRRSISLQNTHSGVSINDEQPRAGSSLAPLPIPSVLPHLPGLPSSCSSNNINKARTVSPNKRTPSSEEILLQQNQIIPSSVPQQQPISHVNSLSIVNRRPSLRNLPHHQSFSAYSRRLRQDPYFVISPSPSTLAALQQIKESLTD